MDGLILMVQPLDEIKQCAKVLDLKCEPVEHLNPYGALAYATVTLQGWVADVHTDGYGELEYRDDNLSTPRTTAVIIGDEKIKQRHRGEAIVFVTMKSGGDVNDDKTDLYGLILQRDSRNRYRSGEVYRRTGGFQYARIHCRSWKFFDQFVVEKYRPFTLRTVTIV